MGYFGLILEVFLNFALKGHDISLFQQLFHKQLVSYFKYASRHIWKRVYSTGGGLVVLHFRKGEKKNRPLVMIRREESLLDGIDDNETV